MKSLNRIIVCWVLLFSVLQISCSTLRRTTTENKTTTDSTSVKKESSKSEEKKTSGSVSSVDSAAHQKITLYFSTPERKNDSTANKKDSSAAKSLSDLTPWEQLLNIAQKNTGSSNNKAGNKDAFDKALSYALTTGAHLDSMTAEYFNSLKKKDSLYSDSSGKAENNKFDSGHKKQDQQTKVKTVEKTNRIPFWGWIFGVIVILFLVYMVFRKFF